MQLIPDLRYAARMLLKSPVASAIAILTLALGIGANTAMFSLLRQILAGSYAYRDLDRLGVVQSRRASDSPDAASGLSAPDFLDFRANNKSFDGLAAYRQTQFVLDANGVPVPLPGAAVTPGLLTVLGVPPLLGRQFTREEGEPGAQPAVILGEQLWTRQFSRDPALIGQTIRLNGRIYTVAGVMPTTFFREAEVLTPLSFTPEELSSTARAGRGLRVWGRLKPGVTHKQAEADLAVIASRLASEHKETNEGWLVQVQNARDLANRTLNVVGIIYYLPVGFVLLIACANVAHLQLARAVDRRKEVALRTALGASRWRVARQLLSESMMIGLLGGVAGLAVAYAGIQAIQNYLPAQALESIGRLKLDGAVLLFMLVVALVSGLLFGLAPAWKSSRVDLNETLKEGSSQSSGGRGGGRLRQILLVSEIALTTMLLGGAGLSLSLVGGGAYTDMGFDHKNVLAVSALMQSGRFANTGARVSVADTVLAKMKALPGVKSATYATGMPVYGGGANRRLTRPGEKDQAAAARRAPVLMQMVEPGYFETLGVPLRAGRGFAATDREGTALVAIINESVLKQYFPGGNPVGERILLAPPTRPGAAAPADAKAPKEREIVGVVKDIKQLPVDILPQQPIVYVPFAQEPPQFITFAVRTEAQPMGMLLTVAEQIQTVAPEASLGGMGSMEKTANDLVRGIRFLPMVLGSLAALGLILAGVGTYGTTSYSVAQRTKEFGVRMALGADRRRVLSMVLGQGLKITAIGFAVGAALTWGLVKVLLAVLPTGPNQGPELITNGEIAATAAVAVLSLTAAAALANYMPALRATRVDPASAIRGE